MKRVIAAALGGALVAAGAAHASIPPSYKVLVVSDVLETTAVSRGLVEVLSALDAFQWAQSDVRARDVEGCLGDEAGAEACVRAAMAKYPADGRQPPVVVVARAGADGRMRWRCIGTGAKPSDAARRDVTFDARLALFGSQDQRMAERRKAAGCIDEAANEGWSW